MPIRARINATVEIDEQDVEWSFTNGDTWHEGSWLGDAGTSRVTELTVNDTTAPAAPADVNALVRVNGENGPILNVGRVIFREL